MEAVVDSHRSLRFSSRVLVSCSALYKDFKDHISSQGMDDTTCRMPSFEAVNTKLRPFLLRRNSGLWMGHKTESNKVMHLLKN